MIAGSMINEIEFLINKLNDKTNQVSLAFQLCISTDFLSHRLEIIHAYLSIMDDKLTEIVDYNRKLLDIYTGYQSKTLSPC
jgi:hypothetical protein